MSEQHLISRYQAAQRTLGTTSSSWQAKAEARKELEALRQEELQQARQSRLKVGSCAVWIAPRFE